MSRETIQLEQKGIGGNQAADADTTAVTLTGVEDKGIDGEVATNWPILPCGVNENQVRRLIAATLPRNESKRTFMLFWLARLLRALLRSTPRNCEHDTLVLRVFEQWLADAQSYIKQGNYADNLADFRYAWIKVEAVPFEFNRVTLDDTVALADASPLPPLRQKRVSKVKRRLAAVCRTRQLIVGDEDIFLCLRQVGEALDVSHEAIRKNLALLERDNVLSVVQLGGRRRGESAHCGQYRYNFDADTLSGEDEI